MRGQTLDVRKSPAKPRVFPTPRASFGHHELITLKPGAGACNYWSSMAQDL